MEPGGGGEVKKGGFFGGELFDFRVYIVRLVYEAVLFREVVHAFQVVEIV